MVFDPHIHFSNTNNGDDQIKSNTKQLAQLQVNKEKNPKKKQIQKLWTRWRQNMKKNGNKTNWNVREGWKEIEYAYVMSCDAYGERSSGGGLFIVSKYLTRASKSTDIPTNEFNEFVFSYYF